MKLIKQNDNAGGLIFKQNTAGKAMKQNYNFGSYSSISNRSYWIEIPNLINADATGWNFMMWSIGVSNAIPNRHPRFCVENADRTSYVNFREQARITDPLFKSPDFNQNYLAGVTDIFSDSSKFLISFNHDSTTTFIIDKLFLHKSTQTTGSGTSSLENLVIYNRALTNNETSFFYNNKLGNDLLSVVGLVCFIDFNNPIIINNEIGHEDRSGNGNHAIYKGLPTGTLEDQLAFVQSNLIKTW